MMGVLPVLLFSCLLGLTLVSMQEPHFEYYISSNQVISPNLYHTNIHEVPPEILAQAIDLSQPRVTRQAGNTQGLLGQIPQLTGQTNSSECDSSLISAKGFCSTSGSSNFFSLSAMSYNKLDGKFNGSITTNLCPWRNVSQAAMASCIKQQIPDPTWSDGTQKQLPILGRAGLDFHGVNIYSSVEAGFKTSFACTDGYCQAGLAVGDCEKQLQYTCGSSPINYKLLPDSCGGHATPYHYHFDMACDYNSSDSSSHSTLAGWALDGYGIYGKWEGNGEKPTLDACGGHYGPVPETNITDSHGFTFTVPSSGYVYHYHTNDNGYKPYTFACFNSPNATVDQCQSYYEDCGKGYANITTDQGTISYDLYCPCYVANGEFLDQATGSSAAASSHATFIRILLDAIF